MSPKFGFNDWYGRRGDLVCQLTMHYQQRKDRQNAFVNFKLQKKKNN